MIQVIDIKRLAGRTIKRTQIYRERTFIFFTDNSFCIFGNFEGLCQIQTDIFDQEPSDFNIYGLLELGFINQNEFVGIQFRLRQEKKKK